jgi:hypothetical protein
MHPVARLTRLAHAVCALLRGRFLGWDGTLTYARIWLRVSCNCDPQSSMSDRLQRGNDGDRDLIHAREWGKVLRLHR